jgi:hypothetical protein
MVKNNSISAVGVDGDEDDRLFGALKVGLEADIIAV